MNSTDGVELHFVSRSGAMHIASAVEQSLVWVVLERAQTALNALGLPTFPSSVMVASASDWDEASTEEIKGILPEQDHGLVEFLRGLEQVAINANAMRAAPAFPLRIGWLPEESAQPITPELRPAYDWLLSQVSGRSTVTLGELEDVAARWSSAQGGAP